MHCKDTILRTQNNWPYSKLIPNSGSFYNKLKALTDQAPGDYVRLIRLKRAMQLLKEQKYTITEVAEMTGFSDAKYFREVFKKHFNISPSQYAKEEGNIGEGKQ